MDPVSILLVDSNSTFLHLIRRFLDSCGGDMVVTGEAADGREAMVMAQELKPQVIVLDLNMPDLSGLEVIRRLRTVLPQAGIVALTMRDHEFYREAVMEAGGDGLVSKATSGMDLLPTIQGVIRPQQRVS
jgi:DNA-binding NarL/FixJ family response regulator